MKMYLQPLVASFTLSIVLSACAGVKEETEGGATAESDKKLDASKIAENKNNEYGIVCKKRAVTGSRFTKKVCTTPEQREQAKQRAKEMLNKSQSSSVLTNMDGG